MNPKPFSSDPDEQLRQELLLEGVFKEEDIMNHESFLVRSDQKGLEKAIFGRAAPRLPGYRTREYIDADGKAKFILVKEGTVGFRYFYRNGIDLDSGMAYPKEVPLEPAN